MPYPVAARGRTTQETGGAAPSPLLTGLVSYWPLTSNANDVHGSNNLTNNNSVTFGAGGADFNGSSQSLSHADNADLSTGDIDFTLALKVRFDTNPGCIMIGKWNGDGSNSEYVLSYDQLATLRFEFIVRKADDSGSSWVEANSLGAPSIGVDYTIIAWHDASANTINIQVDGGTVDSVSYSAGVRDGGAAFTLGAYSLGLAGFLDGKLKDVGLWKKVLSGGERTTVFSGATYPF